MAPRERQAAKFKEFKVHGPKERLIQAPNFTDRAVQRIIEGKVATMRKAIAIDFDGCLCTNAYPAIGQPNWAVINRAKQEQSAGAGLILWTCREGDLLQQAVDACRGWGLAFDAVNESLPDWIEAFNNRPRKVGASEYWDDRAVRLPCGVEPLTIEQLKQMGGQPVWIVEHPDWGHWELSEDAEDYLQDRDAAFYGMTHDDPCGKFGLHALGWLAYRDRPEVDHG